MNAAVERQAAFCELAAEVARSSGEVQLKLMGTSMLPAVWPGDLVTIQHCSAAELQPGQIVLYSREGTLTAHRILRIAADRLILRGDSLAKCDPPVETSQIVGRVTWIVRQGRTVSVQRSLWQRALSWVLRRSEFWTRITLHLGGRLLRS